MQLLNSILDFVVNFFGMGNPSLGIPVFIIWAIAPLIKRKRR